VIGVVGDVRNTALNQESPALYYPAAFRVWPSMDVVVRADSAPEPVLAAARQKIRGLDAELALSNVRTMDEWLANTAAQPRLNAALLAAYAITALAIAAVGIYGVLAYSVGLRTREIGLRLALGAPRQDVVRMVVREGMRLASFGIAGGVAAAVALSRVLEGLVFGVQVRDPATFVLVVIALAGVALVACSVPARRAARVDPMVALRVE
jgi:putative ABC transport system permease protein